MLPPPRRATTRGSTSTSSSTNTSMVIRNSLARGWPKFKVHPGPKRFGTNIAGSLGLLYKKPPYQYRSSSRKPAKVGRRSASVLVFLWERGSGKARTRTTAISTPQITKRAGQDTFINVTLSRQNDSESQTFHSRKRIPPDIPKLRQSSACVNRLLVRPEPCVTFGNRL